MIRIRQYPTMLLILLFVCGLQGVTWGQDKRVPVKIEGKSVLPLRVLARAFSNIYKEPDVSKGTVEENVPTFQPYYVYTRPEVKATGTDIQGWYEVGSDNRGTILGWMRAEDVFEWKQNMSLAYTHPEGRKPVLMFETREVLLDLVKAPGERRKQRVDEIYAALEAGGIPADFPIRSVEPKKAIDISKQFYLLPILEFGEVELDQYEGRLLKLAAAILTGPDAREQSTVKSKTGSYLQEATKDAAQEQELLKKLETDIVFVIDMTASMQPYIDATLEAIKNIALLITRDAQIRQSVHFGLWGYRYSVQDIPGLEFLTKNFTPTLQSVEAFEKILQRVREASVGSGDYPEDVFSGVDDAMRKTQWSVTEGLSSLRFLVLIGDAPSHEAGHRWNYSGQTEQTLRQDADDHAISIFALHIKDPDSRLQELHTLAEKQFRVLSRNKGTGDQREGTGDQSAYFSINALDVNSFAQATRNVANLFVVIEQQAKQGKIIASATTGQTGPSPAAAATAAALAANMGRAALVEWIGKQAGTKAPRDIIAWAVDKDLLNPAMQSMEVRLLINKRQLDEIRKALGEVLTAGRQGQIGGEDLFTVLQGMASIIAQGQQDRIRQARSMAELVPEFLVGLPYKSQLMAMTKSLWTSWSNDQQDDFLKQLDAKINLYKAIHDTTEGWIQLHQGDGPDEFVYPISLEALP